MSEMKALSVWQPWATLLAIRAKRFETRGWPTKYRGPIAIHAAAKPVHESLTGLLLGAEAYTAIIAALVGHYRQGHPGDLPTGAVIATADLIGCHTIDRVQEMMGAPWETGCWDGNRWIDPTDDELLFGDWTPGRFAWELANVRMLDKPIPAKGRQGLWTWEGVAS